MKFFLDTANIDEIKAVNDMGVISGVTTNPSLIAKEGKDFKETIKEIASIVDGAISGEVNSDDAEGMIKENLKQINKDEAWLYSILKSHEIKKAKEVLLCILDEYDKILIQKKK